MKSLGERQAYLHKKYASAQELAKVRVRVMEEGGF